jgi:hypothetical protein
MPTVVYTFEVPTGVVPDLNSAISESLGEAGTGLTNQQKGHEAIRLHFRELVKSYRIRQSTGIQVTYDSAITQAQSDIDAAITSRNSSIETVRNNTDTDFVGV